MRKGKYVIDPENPTFERWIPKSGKYIIDPKNPTFERWIP
jgi:hypothetical protein